ncbi:MAG: MBL fold metallo-hydrolase [Planctomycetes bacterium]|nr:MBL fold metallo-hydrolase [Planctomycetota bacterium]
MKSALRIKIACSHPPASRGHLSTTFIINGEIAVDAGAIASGLALREQRRIRHVLLTHAHLDHLHELPQFLDNVQTGGRSGLSIKPICLHGEAAALEPVSRHLFGGLWPDVLRPAIGFASLAAFDLRKRPALSLGGFKIRPFRTVHRVPTVGFLFERTNGSVAILADTGYREGLLDHLLGAPRLRFLAMEISYPNRLERWALDHGHLTPRQFLRLVEPLLSRRPRLQIGIHHLKPAFAAEVLREISALRSRAPGLRVLRHGDRFFFNF